MTNHELDRRRVPKLAYLDNASTRYGREMTLSGAVGPKSFRYGRIVDVNDKILGIQTSSPWP